MRTEKAPKSVRFAVRIAFEILLGFDFVFLHEVLNRNIPFAKLICSRKDVFLCVLFYRVRLWIRRDAVKVIGKNTL